ncbi:MAG: H-X9-DG-CTERM domain-containing protein [Verrucomicrobiota bacterium]
MQTAMRTKGINSILTKKSCVRGFSLYELLVVVSLLVVLAALLGISASVWRKLRKSSSLNTCVSNLGEIGKALQVYSQDNGGHLPYAGVNYGEAKKWSWDDFLNKQLSENWAPSQLDTPTAKDSLKLLLCPSDNPKHIISRLSKDGANKRTYAMPAFAKTKSNWPPRAESSTGIGIHLEMQTSPELARQTGPPDFITASTLTKSQVKAAFSMAMVSKPLATIAITERVHPRNVIGNIEESTIPNATEHIHYQVPVKPADYHANRFNYLMLDGHVETLEPLQTLGSTNSPPAIQSGMWTINPND